MNTPPGWSSCNDLSTFFFRSKRLTLDWKNPFGYLLALLSEWMAVYSIIQTTIPVTCFFVGSCCWFIAFANDITSDLDVLNIGGLSNRAKIKMRLCNIVRFHLDAKQLSV